MLLCQLSYRAESWDRKRRVVAKVEGHPGELVPRVGLDPLCGSSVTPGLQSRQLHADACFAEGDGTLVVDHATGLSGKADQGW